MNFFTSDLHLSHANIIKYCNRPFDTIEEMDETIINNWNRVVTPKDTVYNLGDLSMHLPTDRLVEVLKRLNGRHVFIIGNHDGKNVTRALKELNIECHKMLEITVNDDEIGKQGITLCHYPLLSWNCSHRGAWNLYGHHHGTTRGISHGLSPRHLDVGQDKHNFTPISFHDVKVTITRQHMEQE